jgi:ligand-binding sensor domain-containing protein
MGRARILSIFLVRHLSILSIIAEMKAEDCYTVSDELNANNIIAIAQTEDGYLWILAGHDVLRFDGRGFEKWPSKPGHQGNDELLFQKELPAELQRKVPEYGLSFGQIQAGIEDSGGFTWVGTKFGLKRLTKASNGKTQSEYFINKVDVLSFFVDREGNI